MVNLHEDMGYDDFLREQAEVERCRLLEAQLAAQAEPVVGALGKGVLAALARYLKTDAPYFPSLPEGMAAIPQCLADELVDMIEGHHWFKLGVTSTKRGQTRSDYLRVRAERLRVGCFVEARVRQLGRGSYESAVEDAREKYRTPRGHAHHRSYVTRAHAEVKKFIKELEAAGSDGWRLLTELYV